MTRSVTKLLTSDVSGVPLRLGRNADLRFIRRIATWGTPETRSPGRNPAVAPGPWQSTLPADDLGARASGQLRRSNRHS